MSNPITLTLAGHSYELKPDFAVLMQLEDAFGASLIDIADFFTSGEARLIRMVEALAIILSFPRGSQAMLGEEIVETGVGLTLKKLQEFFLAALGIAPESAQNGGIGG